jgi:hypothetical protein
MYLRETNQHVMCYCPELDNVLTALINEITRISASTRILAIIACLDVLSVDGFANVLRPGVDGDFGLYLRCLTLARHIIPSQDYTNATALITLVTEPTQTFRAFQSIIESIAASRTSTFTPPSLIHSVLEQAGVERKLRTEIDSNLGDGKIWTTFQLVKWPKTIPHQSLNAQATLILGQCLESWWFYLAWNPNEARIQIWESRTRAKHRTTKIIPLIGLDGPGIAQYRHYKHLKLEPHDAEHLERFLHLLSQAHSRGVNSLDLFIHTCVDSVANEEAFSTIEKILGKGDDGYCLELLTVMRALDGRSSLIRRMEDLTSALQLPGKWDIFQDLHGNITHIMEMLNSNLILAQENFCKQLKTVIPELLGEHLHDFPTQFHKQLGFIPVFPLVY